jgi:Mlc titration factor MtfA (ptsG expression regulator)
MPQDSVSITLPYKDSSFTVYSLEEYSLLPDSLKGSPEQQRFVDSIFQLYTQTSAPATETEESISNDDIQVPGILFFIFIAIMIIRQMRKDAREQVNEPFTFDNDPNTGIGCYTYPGRDLKFSVEEIHTVCNKHNPYFQKLGAADQQLFTERAQRFIRSKNFYICAPRGYREMPILVSAAAVQISFGLKNYLLPHFSNIIIHPEEYFAYDPLRVLIGNVQGQSITLSWKHFLEDYQQPTDGKNVGLHEMAHALQVQYLFRKPRQANTFKDDFEHFDRVDDEVLLSEKTKTTHLFDANALSNKNEFWATSIELFFEKPVELKEQYPQLYNSICRVLNQDPAAM